MRRLLYLFLAVHAFSVGNFSYASKKEDLEDNTKEFFRGSFGNINWVPLLKKDDIIKTKSQKPIKPKPQCVVHVSISATPNRESFNGQEIVLKKIIPGIDGRKRIDQTHEWPTSAHGVVSVRFPSTPPDSYCWEQERSFLHTWYLQRLITFMI